MTNEEAKFILSGYRSSGRDAGDAMFAEALKQAQSDPALGAWFAREQAHTTVVSAKLSAIAPPAGLREAILAGGRVSGATRAWWRQPVWLAAAAAVAVVIGGASFWRKTTKEASAGVPSVAAAVTDPLAKFAFADALEGMQHGGHGAALASLQVAMKDPAMRLTQALPVNFEELERTGCRTVWLDQRPVLEVCFERNGTWFHCYIGRSEDFPEMPARQAPVFAESGEVTTASWSNGVYRVVVASLAGREVLGQLL